MQQVSIHDEYANGDRFHTLTIDMLTTHITLRELIRRRVYQEVKDYNNSTPGYFQGLVQPKEAEKVLNGYKLREKRKIDWEQQYKLAIDAFTQNGYFVLVDHQQIEDLDTQIELRVDTEVCFIKLVPLVGG
ncbi:hypothetical protein [Candidatus Uabimicrobium amorphum]|uniref:Uncharacterized protein n=1 Tax=Uabimicrobium amorphum TaxID=2596890 RepID=A0A5S9ILN1_UABAM|nr:hypothetical protein [Candidatus Uabimicrobium amorphum]BBM83807.1 hypothetical protein UABAM_02162 [Candidatus Uabimicrobium amorphum]